MGEVGISGIYRIRNILDDKEYWGSAKDFDERWYLHIRDLERNKHHSPKLQHAWNLYGAYHFVFEEMEIVNDLSKLLEREQVWIDASECVKLGYNCCPVAGSKLGWVTPEETKRKISEAQKGQAAPWAKYKRSDETKERMSIAQRSYKHTTGYKFTEQTKERMRKPKSPKHAAKLREILIKRNKEMAAKRKLMKEV